MPAVRVCLLAVLLIAGAAALGPREEPRATAGGAPSVRFARAPSGAFAGVQVEGLPASAVARAGRARLTDEEWQRFFRVRAEFEGSDDPDVPPMIGRYEPDGTTLRFAPHAAPEEELTYVAVFDRAAFEARFGGPGASPGGPPTAAARFRAADRPGAPRARVEQVYPTRDELPANALRLYVHFSAPMGVGRVYEHVALLDAQGREVPGAFLRLDQELWDAGRRRLTLLFDPGRIKRGLRANLEAGAPLRAGRQYRLVIAAGLRDARGRPLAQGFEKRFTVTADDRAPPDAASWQIAAPPAGSREPLVIRFREPLDRALAARSLSIVGPDGHEISGAASVEDEETAWRLAPAVAWQAGVHSLVVSSSLEDLAGNSLAGVFDRDLASPGGRSAGALDPGPVTRSFRIDPPPAPPGG